MDRYLPSRLIPWSSPDDDYDEDENTSPGLQRYAHTIVGPLLDARAPAGLPLAPRIPYAERYPPVIDAPINFLYDCLVPEALDHFDDDDAVVVDVPVGPVGTLAEGSTPTRK